MRLAFNVLLCTVKIDNLPIRPTRAKSDFRYTLDILSSWSRRSSRDTLSGGAWSRKISLVTCEQVLFYNRCRCLLCRLAHPLKSYVQDGIVTLIKLRAKTAGWHLLHHLKFPFSNDYRPFTFFNEKYARLEERLGGHLVLVTERRSRSVDVETLEIPNFNQTACIGRVSYLLTTSFAFVPYSRRTISLHRKFLVLFRHFVTRTSFLPPCPLHLDKVNHSRYIDR